MKPVNIRLALWKMVSYLDGKVAIPLRHVAVLLFVLEQGETTSPEIQKTFSCAQAPVSRIIVDLKALGLLETYKGATKADIVAPTDKGRELKAALEAMS